jgi:glycosyltransferase involved in cell wall biosynthesis
MAPSTAWPRRRALRVAWLGHRSATAGDGLITYSREMTRGLLERGLDVVFFHHDPGQAGDGSIALDAYRVSNRLLVERPGSRRRLQELLRWHHVDIVHVSLSFSSLDVDIPRTCHRLGLPAVATFHVPFDVRNTWWGGLSKTLYRIYSGLLARYDRVIVFGGTQAMLLKRMGVPPESLLVLPNGVDVERWCPGPSNVRARFGADRLFTYMGRLSAEKHVEELLRAFTEVSPQGVRLLIVGGGKDRRCLERRYGGRQVVFLGNVGDERERVAILRASDAFFLPSSIEGLSLALLEAMACGTTVVATDVGVDGDAIRGAGILLDPTCLEVELQLAIRMLTERPHVCRELGRVARRRAIERYSLAVIVDRLVQMYAELAGASMHRVDLSRQPALVPPSIGGAG